MKPRGVKSILINKIVVYNLRLISYMPNKLVAILLLFQNKPWLVRYKKIRAMFFLPGHGMEWKTIFPYSIRAIFFHSILHSILKFSSIFHSILPYQGNFKPEATRSLYCIFATLSVLLQVVAREGKQHGTTHLIPYLKDYRNELQ